jgi:soluble lytic murein transglycosylase-like protein
MTMTALILAIALDVGVPPYLALSIALEENPQLDPVAVHLNLDGSEDRGLMQLNSGWFTGDWQEPEANIRAGCLLLKELIEKPDLNVWQAVVAYNCGYRRLKEGPPWASVDYACRVFRRWNGYRGYKW